VVLVVDFGTQLARPQLSEQLVPDAVAGIAGVVVQKPFE
jgi:hypothetical protein